MKTILKDRVLWHDGAVTFTPEQLMEYVLNGGEITRGIHIDALSEDIKSFNKLSRGVILNVKKDLDHLDYTWNIPEKFKNINIKSYIRDKLVEEIQSLEQLGKPLTDDQVNTRIDRITQEVKLYEENDMFIILKTVIYIIDTFKHNNVIWGTGRGSSCASYVLYLLGLHNVDSVKYELDIKEFFK